MIAQADQQTSDAVTVSRVEWAPVPKVNLLPPEILVARGFRKVQFRLAFAVVATIVLIAAGVVWAQREVSGAREALDSTVTQTSQLRRQESRYAEVPKLASAVVVAKTARETALAKDMLWYRLMSDIALATPSNVWLSTMDVSLAEGSTAATGSSASSSGSASAPGASAEDPLVPVGIGHVIVTGTAASYPDIAAWIEAVVRVRGLDGSTVQTITRASGTATGGVLQFTSKVVIDKNALSHRYDRKAG